MVVRVEPGSPADEAEMKKGDIIKEINKKEIDNLATLPLSEATWQRLPIEADLTALALTPAGDLFVGTRDERVRRAP